MAGKFTDALDGSSPGLKWPVACWKSPQFHVTAPADVDVPSPIPPHAFVDYTNILVGAAELGYSKGDNIRLQRPRIGGANNFMHPIWDDARKTHMLTSGNAANAYYFNRKDTAVNVAATNASWNQYIHGAWPLLRSGAIHEKIDRKSGLSFKQTSQIRILRNRISTPWQRFTGSPMAVSYDLKQFGHTDEPAIIQLWAKCLDQDNGYGTGDELMVIGNDGGGASTDNGGEVWYNGSTVGYTVASGHSIVSDAGAQVAMTPSKWAYQLRMAFAADPDDRIDYRNKGNMISMFYSRWEIPLQGKRITFMLPNNFNPIDIGISLRCNVSASASGGYSHNDQIYSRNAGTLGYSFVPSMLVRGRLVIVQLPTTNALTVSKTGAGGVTALSAEWGLQIRAIG